MAKKHQTRSIYTAYQRISLKQLLEKAFKPAKENPILLKKTLGIGTKESNCQRKKNVLLIKLLTLFNQLDGKKYQPA